MRYIEHKIEKDGFNSFTAANDDNFGTQMTERQSRFLADKQNFWGHLEIFFKRSYEFFWHLKPFCKKLLNLVLRSFINMSAK